MEIKFTESEFKGLIDREKASSDATRAYEDQLKLLKDLVNYGSNLLPRCYMDSEKQLTDVILLGTLLRQVIAMLDGFEILATQGAIYAASLQARALLEASLIVDWILSSDSEKKAKYYYVHNVRNQRLWALRTKLGTAESAQFASEVADLGLPDISAFEAQSNKVIAGVDRVLSKPEFKEISEDFDRLKRRNASWYEPLGPRNLRMIAKEVGRNAEYTMFYNRYSEVMHGSRYGDHFQLRSKEQVIFQNVRMLGDFQAMFQFTVSGALKTFQKLLSRYRPGELENLKRKYSHAWRDAFFKIPKVVYEDSGE